MSSSSILRRVRKEMLGNSFGHQEAWGNLPYIYHCSNQPGNVKYFHKRRCSSSWFSKNFSRYISLRIEQFFLVLRHFTSIQGTFQGNMKEQVVQKWTFCCVSVKWGLAKFEWATRLDQDAWSRRELERIFSCFCGLQMQELIFETQASWFQS
jgi:hypothetical protein